MRHGLPDVAGGLEGKETLGGIPALGATAPQQLGDARPRVGDREAGQPLAGTVDDDDLMLACGQIQGHSDMVADEARSCCLHGGSSSVVASQPRANHGRHGLCLSVHRLILDNGPEFVATAVHEWLADLGVTTLFIEPGSPWENGSIESFKSKLRDELLGGEIFYTLREAQILIADWRRLYNGLRPHGSLGNRPPAPETIVFPGFSLADYAPPSLTQEVSPALT